MDSVGVRNLSEPPPNWSMEADEELVRFLVDNCQINDSGINGANLYVESIAVSTVSLYFCCLGTEVENHGSKKVKVDLILLPLNLKYYVNDSSESLLLQAVPWNHMKAYFYRLFHGFI